MTLREQIEALGNGDEYPGRMTFRKAITLVLDIIDAHRCVPDRDALARALRSLDSAQVTSFWDYYLADLATDDRDWQEVFADAIIAALEEP